MNDCESILTADILSSSTSENEANVLKLLKLKIPERVIIDQLTSIC